MQLQAFNIFEECGIHFIEIGDNVTVTSDRIFYNCKDIEEITIGDNFTSASRWIEGGSIKKVTLGANATLADNGLAGQYNASVKEVTINGPIKQVGTFSLCGATIHTPDGTLTIADGATIGGGGLSGISGINKIKLGSNVSIIGNGYACINPTEDVVLECNSPITIKGWCPIAGYVILPTKMEFTGDSNVNEPFFNNIKTDVLEEMIVNPGATITSLRTNLGNWNEELKITLKNISEWDSTLLENNKTVIQNYGLTNYEEIDRNGIFKKP